MTQTLALLVDAYRDLNSRKMFWIVLILSVVFAGAFAGVNITPTGVKFLFWKLPGNATSNDISNATFQIWFFYNIGVNYWLAWAASILALISTAGIFPSLIADGAIELYLSKPIGRFRLFLTKYLFGLLFVALQITCYCTVSFLVVGLRGKEWEPAIFIAVPVVVLFFSYIFCVSTLVGVVTRSTVAAILFTLLFWLSIWSVGFTEYETLSYQIRSKNELSRLDREIVSLQGRLDRLQGSAGATPSAAAVNEIAKLKADINVDQDKKTGDQDSGVFFHNLIIKAEYPLPKTTATITFLQRELIQLSNLPAPEVPDNAFAQRRTFAGDVRSDIEADAEIRDRSMWWTFGTSVGFETVVVLLAAWIFCRRDY